MSQVPTFEYSVPIVAYFSMEVGLEPKLPTYSGGLGVLAGDSLRAAADLSLPVVGISLVHRKGYFHQELGENGQQMESPAEWSPESFLEPLAPRASVTIEGRRVRLRAWRYLIRGVTGYQVPVYLLDSALPENDVGDQALTDYLYGGDARYRLCQEAILGLGGIAMLRALGYAEVEAYHMNEGHSALLAVALLEEQAGARGLEQATEADRDAVQKRCVFTTHTPVPAGHDQFPLDVAQSVLGQPVVEALKSRGCCLDGTLNMTYLALTFSRYVNGVAMRHRQVTRGMFPRYPINSITNGVHAVTWTTAPLQGLFDHYIPEWRHDNLNLRHAVSIPMRDIQRAHAETKQHLLAEVERRLGVHLNAEVLTIGFARRAATYKRADLVFADIERLKRIALQVGPLQLIYGGKAHPKDEMGKAMIRRVFEAANALRNLVPVVYLEEYDMEIARDLCAGVDLWLNTPQKPQEASGTSGMKAALNGVPSLSILDGWWVEGHVEGVTGWSIDDSWEIETNSARETASLYDKLETVVLPMFYSRPSAYAEIRRDTIAINGSFFNAQRMMLQYLENAYRVPAIR